MPGCDGTGPMGQGPKTGRGRGMNTADNQVQNSNVPQGNRIRQRRNMEDGFGGRNGGRRQGLGRGQGLGNKQGAGRGRGQGKGRGMNGMGRGRQGLGCQGIGRQGLGRQRQGRIGFVDTAE